MFVRGFRARESHGLKTQKALPVGAPFVLQEGVVRAFSSESLPRT